MPLPVFLKSWYFAGRYDADVAVGDVHLLVADLRLALAGHEIRELVVAFVDLAADLASRGDRHQHELRLLARPDDLAELVVVARELYDRDRELCNFGHRFSSASALRPDWNRLLCCAGPDPRAAGCVRQACTIAAAAAAAKRATAIAGRAMTAAISAQMSEPMNR